MVVDYNKKQQEALTLIDDFLKDSSKKFFYLFGYAGTGKTFTISKIINDLLRMNKVDHVFICASTHKALKILESYFRSGMNSSKKSDSIDYLLKVSIMTLQKLLNYKPVIDNESGKKIFKAKEESKYLKKLESKIVIIDECSMISSNMIDSLVKYVEVYPIKVIFLGDDAQLPPVDEPLSEVFNMIPINYPFHIVLDEIMRTKSTEIKEVAKIIRTWTQKESLPKLLLPIHNLKKSFKLYHQKSNVKESTWFKNFIKRIDSGEVPIILTWRNDRSIMYNNLIRHHIHQATEATDLVNYRIEDYVVFNNFYTSPIDCSTFYTSDMVKIFQMKTEKRRLLYWSKLIIEDSEKPVDLQFNALLTKLDAINLEFKIDILTVEKLHSDVADVLDHTVHPIATVNRTDLETYEKTKDLIKEHLEIFYKKFQSEKHSSKLWNAYHKYVIDSYADIIFGYSMTTHKAQGSTFGIVFVDLDDITDNPKKDEMQKALYTASTRASNELGFILGNQDQTK